MTINNPSADASQISDEVLNLAVKLDYQGHLSHDEREAIQLFRRAGDYIAAAMIFLKDNTLLQEPLTHEHIKHRLLGHWGTCPGLVLVYAHMNRLITKYDLDALYVVGPGHGAPGILAALWLEGSISRFFPDLSRDKKGLNKFISGFSTPTGFPSHINAATPGAIHEGGELGYALSVAFGAVMDRPNLIVPCVVGDGEAETGPTATAWHAFKYIDPKESGAVLPIVHVNGFKISERTIYGCMDNKEIVALFTGYGYQTRIVEDLENLDDDLAASMEWAIGEIHKIQKAARVDKKPIVKPRYPVIILRTPKGLGCPKSFHGESIEGSFHAHQVPFPGAKTNADQLKVLDGWLQSYKPSELFTAEGAPVDKILSIIPSSPDKRMGQRIEGYDCYIPIKTPNWQDLGVKKGGEESCMKQVGNFLAAVIDMNPESFRIFSPDELMSNKLEATLQHSGRNFQWDPESRGKGGRIIEILSEHTCQGMLQGYTLTGRTGVFPSYESFLGIIATMMVQYSKFCKMRYDTPWRQPGGSINYITTSTWTRQEHNGYSHQNPNFIGSVLNLKGKFARVYLPPDANCFLSTISHCVRSKDYVNLMVGSKQPTPVWLSPEEADKHCIAGASTWKFASTDEGVDPDVVLVGIGVEMTFEVIAAASLLRKHCPALRVRVVNVTDLMILGEYGSHPHALSEETFNALFTEDKAVVFNYHGYPIELKGLLFGRPRLERITIAGYSEEGSTTTPFDMMLLNGTSRFDLAQFAILGGALRNPKVATDAHVLVAEFKHMIKKQTEYIMANGKDVDGIYDVPKFK
jgi:xylulose-5-phosphate/fructose-6-phosphate phosphoketolase